MKYGWNLMKCVLFLIIFFHFLQMPATGEQVALMMATTTSTDDTGLLEYLMPHFTRETGIEVKWIANGTGKALKLGENCDADVLLVHAPAAEKKFVSKGYGVARRKIMYNDFIVIGPTADPAKIKGKSVSNALKNIYGQQTLFISRGDNSGTHKKEIELWQAADAAVPDKSDWYLQTGQGMLATIRIANERNGYVFTDRGTYIKYLAQEAGSTPFEIMVEKDPVLANQYSIIPIHPGHCPDAAFEKAKQLSDWLAGSAAQGLIGKFKLSGQVLFIPNAK
jgi:tungstate transport system substrate-binding protein